MISINDIDINKKKVLIRVDYNVPIEDGNIMNYFRLNSSIETIKYCLSQKASVILMSHLGRPDGPDLSLSLEPIVDFLTDKFNTYVHFSDDCISKDSIDFSQKMLPGEIHLLENLRFYKEETDNNDVFSKKLSKHADIYICDSFGTAHRKHASNSSILKYMATKSVGYLMLKEFKYLKNSESNCSTILIGGAKISSKIKMIMNYLDKCDSIIVGGAMAFTLLKSKGINIGNSLVEEDMLGYAGEILSIAKSKKIDIHLPVDVVCSKKINEDCESDIKSINHLDDDDIGLDIGPETTMIYLDVLSNSKCVIWNGPMGMFENFNYAMGTTSMTAAIKNLTMNNNLISIIGGGDTVRAIEMTESVDSFTHVSTGGGASLKLLSGEKLDFLKSWEIYE